MLHEFRYTLRLSLPLIISNIAQIGLGLIDSAMVGAISYKQLAASSLVLNVIGIPHVICIGLTIAITANVSIARGQQNNEAASGFLYNGVWLNTTLSILIAALCTLASPLLYHLGQDADVVPIAVPYFIIMSWALVPMTVFLSFKQFSDALEFTRTGMLLALISLPMNAFFCWIFIYGHLGMPRLELLGAGLATLITRIIISVVMVAIVYRHKAYAAYMAVRKTAWKFRKHTVHELLHMGIPSGLQLAMEVGAFNISGIMIGWMGATAQAAHQIALNCASTTFMAVVGFAMGGSIRVAHAFGSREPHRLALIGKSTLVGGLVYGLACGLCFVLFRNQLPLLFNNNSGVVAMAAQLLLVAAVFQVSDATQAIGAGLCRGIKDVKMPTVLVTVAYWVIGIPVGYWLAFPMHMGASGIWWGFVAGLSGASIFLNRRFFVSAFKMEKAVLTAN